MGAGLLDVFSQCSCFMLCFLLTHAAVPQRRRWGGGVLSLYNCSFSRVDCCCLLVLASLEMDAGGILFSKPAFILSGPSVAGPSGWGFLSISVPSPRGIYLLLVFARVSRPFPRFTLLVEDTVLRMVSWSTPKGRSFCVFSFFPFPIHMGVYLCPTWFQGYMPSWQQWLISVPILFREAF